MCKARQHMCSSTATYRATSSTLVVHVTKASRALCSPRACLSDSPLELSSSRQAYLVYTTRDPSCISSDMLRQQKANLCLLASIVTLLHVHVLAGQDVLGTQLMVLIRQCPILRQYLLCGQGLRNHRHSLEC